MKKRIYCMLLGVIALAGVSCKHSKLDNVDLIKTTDRSISGDGIVTDGITKDNETVKVPFKILLSAPATKAFQVGVSFNVDTVNQLIANGTLTNAVVLPAGSVDFPSVVNVAYGADSGTGVATIRLSAIEKNYGKTVAFAFKLTNPGKGNEIKGGATNILVVINTAELIKPEEIHYLSILNGGPVPYKIVLGTGYTTSVEGITIPLTINLAGIPSSAFNVRINLNNDTIAALKQSGVLPTNAEALNAPFFLDSNVRVNSNTSSATIRLKIGWPVLDGNIAANKSFAFVISLYAPTKHILKHPDSEIIVLVDPNVNLDNNSYITGNGTGLKAEYFTDNQLLDFDGRKPTLVRIEPSINHQNDGDWQNEIGPSISHDNFSTRWTGQFLAPVRGDYIFYQDHWDDGSRLWINGVAVIDDFTTQWDRPERKVTIHMERGVLYKIEADHRENVGGQRAILDYEVPSVGIGRRNVPQSQLFPAP